MSNLQNFRPNYFFEWSRTVPHVAQADVLGNGEGIAIAVVAIDANNQDLHYIRLDRLDEIDLRNLAKILQSRDAGRWPLWDLLSQRHLPNGMNALNFFNQLVWTRTISGQNAPFNKGSNATVPLHTIFGLGTAYRGGPVTHGQSAFASHLEDAKPGRPKKAPVEESVDDETEDYAGQSDIGDLSDYAPEPAAPQAPKRAGRPPRVQK